MKLKIKKSADNGRSMFSLAGEISIYTVKGLKKLIDTEFGKNASVELEMSGIDRIDTAGFQLLLYMQREAESMNTEILFRNVNEAVKSVFNFYRETCPTGA